MNEKSQELVTSNPQSQARALAKLNDWHVNVFHNPDVDASPTALSNDSAQYQYGLDYRPDRWIVVVRATAGFVWIYANRGRSALSFRLDRGSLELPIGVTAVTIQTVGFSGMYDVYAVQNVKDLIINA